MLFRSWLLSIMLLLSFGFTVASHTVGAISGLVTSLINTVGGSTVANEAFDLLGRKISGLQSENSRQKKKIVTLKARAKNPEIKFAGKTRKVKEVVSEVVGKIRTRTKKLVGVTIAEMPAESVPIVGIAIIAATAAYEIDSACDTMTDLQELDVAFNPEHQFDNSVCGVEVPTKEDLLESWNEEW